MSLHLRLIAVLSLVLVPVLVRSADKVPKMESVETVPVRVPVRAGGVFGTGREEEKKNRHRFQIRAFAQTYTLDLMPNENFVSPRLRVQRVRAEHLVNGSRFHPNRKQNQNQNWDRFGGESVEELRGCFYKGTVNSDPDSLVSVSLCRGVRGTFFTGGVQFFIQPVGNGDAETFWQAHEVKRRVVRDTTGTHRETVGGGVRFREKRFVSAARYIETLVVADYSMAQFYGDDIKHYVLTLMSVAAQLYSHPSLKNAVSVVVVKMLVVEDQEAGPELSSNGGVALRNFCAWQQLFNPSSQRHPEHYDTAVLFTREDICGHQHCDTLGVADVGTMCDPKRSCSVIEDNGLQSAFTVSHELGHVLSMPHDDSRNCEKLFGHIDEHHMMAPIFVHLNKMFPWSPCSALYITEFFDNGHGDCLLDVPEQTIPVQSDPPGLTYGLDRQCQQAFGEEFARCPDAPQELACAQLWCREEGKLQCTTRNGSLPWADGTPCGGEAEGRSCRGGVCLPNLPDGAEREVPVDGGWGSWGPWGPCSRSCGGGVEFSQRECTEPVPTNGGSYCLGQRVKYQSCHVQSCPGDLGKSFREEQCEKHNSERYLDAHGNVKQWIPKYAGVSPRDRCKLICRSKHSNEFKVFESKVVDGTSCGPDTTSICVQGQCIKAGCDQVIGSNLKLDKCGVCGGDTTSCRKISGSLNKATFGYNDVVTVPAGATNLDVKQRSHHRSGLKHDGNYLAVKGQDGVYVLNGNFSVSTSEQDLPVRGAVLRYSGSSSTLERLLSFGELRESVVVQLLYTGGDASPPKVKYSFYLPRNVPFGKSGLEQVGSAVGNGVGTRIDTSNGAGVGTHTGTNIGTGIGTRTDSSVFPGSGTATGGSEWVPGEQVPDSWVPGEQVPVERVPDSWVASEWSECSKSCGAGWSRRSVECRDEAGNPSYRCDWERRPADIRPCGDLPCPVWQLGPWSGCSRTCGIGERLRNPMCVDYAGKAVETEKCDAGKRPETVSSHCFYQDC